MSRYSKSFNDGQEFLGRYYAKQNKAIRRKDEGEGNFDGTSIGDVAPSRYRTHHGKVRMAERGVSQRDAIKGTQKSGAVIASSGAVVTVIPEPWAASDREKKRAERNKDALVPYADALPDGYARTQITLAQPNILGLVLGKKHCNMQKLIAKQPSPTIRYQVDGNKVTIWGSKIPVERLVDDIGLLAKEAIEKANEMCGPPIPDGKVPDGQAHRRIVVPDFAIGHVLGKNRHNITKLRSDHTAALINFNGKGGVMYVWGKPTEVNKICDSVAKVVAKATEGVKNGKKRKDDKCKRAKGEKMPHERKMKDFEADMKALRRKQANADINTCTSKEHSSGIGAGTLSKKKKQKNNAKRKNKQEVLRATRTEKKSKKKDQGKKAA